MTVRKVSGSEWILIFMIFVGRVVRRFRVYITVQYFIIIIGQGLLLPYYCLIIYFGFTEFTALSGVG